MIEIRRDADIVDADPLQRIRDATAVPPQQIQLFIVEVQHLPATMFQYDEHEQNSKKKLIGSGRSSSRDRNYRYERIAA